MKRSLLAALALLLCLPLVGCGGGQEKEIESEVLAARAENQAKAESVKDEETPELAERNEPDGDGSEGSGDGGVKSAPKTDWDGIISSNYTLQDNKYYFRTLIRKRVGDKTSSVNMTSYIDVGTLESGVICPDALCPHNDPAVCKYIQVNFITGFCFWDNQHYISCFQPSPNAKIKTGLFDLTADSCELLYTPRQDMTSILNVENDTLWLVDITSKTKNKKTVVTYTLCGVSLPAGDTVFSAKLPDGVIPFLVRDGLIWCNTVKSIVALDPASMEQTVILEYEPEDIVGEWYDDTNRGELWFNISDKPKNTGKIYAFSDGACRQIVMPVPDVYYFQLTNSGIYYSAYEPVYIGVSLAPDNPPTYDYANGKVWRVSREDPAGEAALIYDAEGRYNIASEITGYAVFGNHIYFDKIDVVRETRNGVEYVYFSIADDLYKIRVDLETGAEEEIRFE